jgi:ribosomal protein L34E
MTQEVSRPGAARAAAGPSSCARCGAPFHCGIEDAGGCWCARLPPLPRDVYPAEAGCLCEACLNELLRAAGG